MGTRFYYCAQFPEEKRDEVVNHMIQRDIFDLFTVESDHAYIEDSSMGYGAADEADNLITDIAKIVKGTEHDNQLMPWEHEEGDGLALLTNGKVWNVDIKSILLDEKKAADISLTLYGNGEKITLEGKLNATEKERSDSRPSSSEDDT